MVEELGKVDILDGAQHQDILRLFWVLEFQVPSSGQYRFHSTHPSETKTVTINRKQVCIELQFLNIKQLSNNNTVTALYLFLSSCSYILQFNMSKKFTQPKTVLILFKFHNFCQKHYWTWWLFHGKKIKGHFSFLHIQNP